MYPQKKKSVGVTSGLRGGQLISLSLPFRRPGNRSYTEPVQWHKNELQLLAEVHGLISQQDGTPAYFCAIVHTSLRERSPDLWIGRGEPINWPPRIPEGTSKTLSTAEG